MGKISKLIGKRTGRLKSMLLNCVMQSGLLLNVFGVDVGAIFEQQFAQIDRLNGVDQTSASILVLFRDVGSVFDQEFDHFVVGHETGGP